LRKSAILGILISIVFLILAFRNINLKEFSGALTQAHFIYIIFAFSIYLTSFLIRAVRWKIILRPVKNIKFSSSFSVIMIAWMANNLLPARLGEIIRAYVIGKKENISRSASFATIIIERILDGLTLILIFVLLTIFLQLPDWEKRIGLIAGAFFIGSLLFLILMKTIKIHTAKPVIFIINLFPKKISEKIFYIINRFAEGLDFFSMRKEQFQSIILSMFIWLIEGITFYFIIKSLQLQIPWYAAFQTLVIINLGILIPSSPGYIGTYHYFGILALSIFNVGKESALSFAIIIHALQYISVTSIGLFYTYKEGWNLKKLKEART